nr:nucleotide-binding alpha-beta plait domain-containing protein [Tanacetum cinerariifolium]
NIRSKDDDVQNISTSVFVTNFPDQFGANDLWHSCKAYGHVVDTYIPDRRSKENGDGSKWSVSSYAHVVTGYQGNKKPMDNTPTMVLDETCLNNEVYSLSLLGKVKEFASLTNFILVLAKEGFPSIEIKYMGGYWVMIVFLDEETKNRFQSNVAVGSWFSLIMQAQNDFILEERVVWVEIEGVPCKWWSKNTFRRIASRWGTLLNGDELEEGGLYSNSDVETNEDSYEDEVQEINSGHHNNLEGNSDIEAVPETCLEDESNKKFMDENFVRQGKPQSEDPFGIYEALKKKMNVCNNGSISEESSEYPPGFTPKDVVDSPVNDQDVVDSPIRNGKEDVGLVEKQSEGKNARCTDIYELICYGHFKKSGAPRTGGSIVQLMDELVTVGQTMGYDMTGCIKNLEAIIESQGANDEGGCHRSFEAPYPLLPLLVLADAHPLVELVVLYMTYHSWVLRWTILIDSSLVGLTILIEIVVLKTILVVTLLSRLMKSRRTCLSRNILTILNEISD